MFTPAVYHFLPLEKTNLRCTSLVGRLQKERCGWGYDNAVFELQEKVGGVGGGAVAVINMFVREREWSKLQ